jgi:4'-phosphopantetheinyl transferase
VTVESVSLYVERLDVSDTAVQGCFRSLDGDERRRAARFRFERDRRRFIVRRGRLREKLGQHAGVAPEQLSFATGAFGKPVLAGGGLHFSLSHSSELMIVAIANVEVGCDIERIDPDFEWRPVAERLFANNERTTLSTMSDTEARRGFFDCWTRKEAFLKAIGVGLSRRPDTFEVSVGREAAILKGGDGWSVADIDPADGYSGALVVSSPCQDRRLPSPCGHGPLGARPRSR